jgi:hypothetical protein
LASPRRPSPVRPKAQPRAADGSEAMITALRPASGHERAELIRDVIDAFARLRDSLGRLNRLFAPDANCAPAGASLLPLLATLAPHGQHAGSSRQRELRHAIRDARQLDRTRDALFSDAFCRDMQAMRHTLAELERLDVLFVGLAIEHVLAQHERAAAQSGSGEPQSRSRTTRAMLRPRVGAPEAVRHAATLVGETVA